MSKEKPKNEFADLPRFKVVTLIADMKKKSENLRYSYEQECSRRQRLYDRMSEIIGDTELFKFDTYGFINQWPFETKEEKSRAYGIIESVIWDIGNAEYMAKSKQCAKLREEYQTCKNFCLKLKESIREVEDYSQQLKARLVELDRKEPWQ